MAAVSETGKTQQATGALAFAVFVPFACGYFLSYVFRTVNSVLAPNLVADTGIDAADLGFLTSAFFLAFALAQLPLGMALDRFGPRRVEAVLLVIAAAGSWLFATGESLAALTVGRAMIGLGMSACMMAAFKAFVQWFPSRRLPLVNGCLLAVGGTGALAATAPVEWLLAITDWRTVFMALVAACLAVSVALVRIVPEHAEPPAHLGLRAQVRGMATVFRDRYFWRLAPLTVVSQSAFLATQGLWAGPWLRDVAGLERGAVALHLMGLSIAVVAGFFLSGIVATRLTRRGIVPGTVAVGGMTAFALTQLGLAFAPADGVLVLWVLFGLFGTSGTIPYAALSQHFHGQLAGRANTALNLLVFTGAFSVQWGMGGLLHLWEDPVTHTYAPGGYQLAFTSLVVLQAAALAWFVAGRRGAGAQSAAADYQR
ncbi:MFS transporter [Arhodomonas sp. AD133]|uniref:MFS transporter n=1 Tax=Arhodomonas sp. AD133 TaxID=3415009 RepID=UPI003EBFFED8